MAATHTPGPWEYGENKKGRKRVFDSSGWEIVRAMSGSRFSRLVPLVERDANARLIAAAPDLLAAIRSLVNCWECENMLSDKVVIDAKAAIAKATGQQ